MEEEKIIEETNIKDEQLDQISIEEEVTIEETNIKDEQLDHISIEDILNSGPNLNNTGRCAFFCDTWIALKIEFLIGLIWG